jgi:hypothetical protein
LSLFEEKRAGSKVLRLDSSAGSLIGKASGLFMIQHAQFFLRGFEPRAASF